MRKRLTKLLIKGLVASAFLSPFAMAENAEAREYCREYTKSIRVDGRVQTGYGTACQQEDGSWMIVKARGDVDPFDALRKRNVVIVAQDEPVYYSYGPRFQPVTYYAPQRYYYRQPGFYFSFGNDWNRPRQRWNHHDRNRRHDRDHDHHRGRRH
jgi:hypothetical protein